MQILLDLVACELIDSCCRASSVLEFVEFFVRSKDGSFEQQFPGHIHCHLEYSSSELYACHITPLYERHILKTEKSHYFQSHFLFLNFHVWRHFDCFNDCRCRRRMELNWKLLELEILLLLQQWEHVSAYILFAQRTNGTDSLPRAFRVIDFQKRNKGVLAPNLM